MIRKLVFFAVLLAVHEAFGDTVVIDGFRITTVSRRITTTDLDSYNEYPYNGTEAITRVARAHPDGDYLTEVAQSNLSFTENDGQFRINQLFDHVHGDQSSSLAESYFAISFTPEVDMTYQLSGYYEYTSDNATPGKNRIYFRQQLMGNDGIVFENTQVSKYVTDEYFTIGETEGDLSNSLTGTNAGILSANTTYVWTSHSNIYLAGTDTNQGDIWARGSATLLLTPMSAVPTPSSLVALLGMGTMGMIAVVRRRRKRA